MINNLVLVEENANISELKSKIPKKGTVKIISFDVIAHKHLLNLGIEHELVENYIQENDYQLISDNIIEKSLGWHKEERISNFLQYNNINLGWLMGIEIFPYFAQVIKKFVGLIRIIEKERPSWISSSKFLSLMIKEIDSENKIKLYYPEDTTNLAFHFDKIEIPIKIGSKLITIRISRKFALKLKKIMEFITGNVFNLKSDLSRLKYKESILFLDFNPLLYVDLLKELSKLKINMLLLNERRPAAWNFKSLRLLKKSNFKVITLRDLLTDKKLVASEQQKFQENFEHALSFDENFINFFSILGKSFWPAIKENFIKIHQIRFNEAIERSILIKKLYSKLKIKSIVTLYDKGVEEKLILSHAIQLKISTIMLQHGYLPNSKYLKKYFEITPIIPLLGLKIAVWGESTKKLLLQSGINEQEIFIVGSPKHDKFFHTKTKSEKKTILFADAFASEVDYFAFDTKTYIKNEKMIREICKISNNISKRKFIVKLHPGQHIFPYNIKSIIQEVDPLIPIYQSKDIFELLTDCEILVASELSTVLLEAMILGIPTIVFLTHPKMNVDDEIFKSGTTILVKSPQEYQSALNRLLTDVEFKNKLVSRANQFVNNYFSNQGHSSKNFMTQIKDGV